MQIIQPYVGERVIDLAASEIIALVYQALNDGASGGVELLEIASDRSGSLEPSAERITGNVQDGERVALRLRHHPRRQKLDARIAGGALGFGYGRFSRGRAGRNDARVRPRNPRCKHGERVDRYVVGDFALTVGHQPERAADLSHRRAHPDP